MAINPRVILPLEFYHVYNRGAHKVDIFKTQEDFAFFYAKVVQLKNELKINFLGHSCGYNHYHFFIQEPNQQIIDQLNLKGNCNTAISKFISRLENSYTQHFNSVHKHSGVIFQGRYKSKNISDGKYFEHLICYINLNAVKHGLVKNISEWKYTSHHEYMSSKFREFSIVDKYDFIDLSVYRNNLIKYKNKFKLVEKCMSDYFIE